MKVKLLATTKKGSSQITFFDVEQFKQAIKALDGDIQVTFEVLGNDATKKQWWYFKNVLMVKFAGAAHDQGTYLSDQEICSHLLSKSGGDAFKEFLLDGKYDPVGVDRIELSKVIERVEYYINQFID